MTLFSCKQNKNEKSTQSKSKTLLLVYKKEKEALNYLEKERKKVDMWMSFIFVLFVIFAQSGHAIVLDRDQLAAWYPNYLTETSINLYSRQITSISTGTFTGLSQLQKLDLSGNQFESLDAYSFDVLSQLQELDLSGNSLTSLNPSIFNGLSQLLELNLGFNQITSLAPSIFQGLSQLRLVR
jgi:Leucine-rich repeat (LRR) protein